MAATLRRTLTQFTEVVFPVHKGPERQPELHLLKAGNEYASSLPMQMCMYFNLFYFPLWLIGQALSLAMKYSLLITLYAIIQVAIFITLSLIEIIRLYIGYTGNLTEKVPELAGCWLLTILIQLPLLIYQLAADDTTAKKLPLEWAINIVFLCFVAMEIICGFFALRTMVQIQEAKFHLKQFHDLESLDDGLADVEEGEDLDYDYEGKTTRFRGVNSSYRA